MQLEIEVTGVEPVASRFMRLQRRLERPAPGLERHVVPYLHERERERFLTRGDGSWPQLKRSTVRRKGDARILRDTGALMRSLTSKSAGSRIQVRGETLTFGTSLFYARFVAKRRRLFGTGTAAAKRQIAARMVRWLLAELT